MWWYAARRILQTIPVLLGSTLLLLLTRPGRWLRFALDGGR